MKKLLALTTLLLAGHATAGPYSCALFDHAPTNSPFTKEDVQAFSQGLTDEAVLAWDNACKQLSLFAASLAQQVAAEVNKSSHPDSRYYQFLMFAEEFLRQPTNGQFCPACYREDANNGLAFVGKAFDESFLRFLKVYDGALKTVAATGLPTECTRSLMAAINNFLQCLPPAPSTPNIEKIRAQLQAVVDSPDAIPALTKALQSSGIGIASALPKPWAGLVDAYRSVTYLISEVNPNTLCTAQIIRLNYYSFLHKILAIGMRKTINVLMDKTYSKRLVVEDSKEESEDYRQRIIAEYFDEN